MTLYDMYCAPDPSALSATYAFVTATEVLEHLPSPAETLDTIWSCIARGGVLRILSRSDTDSTMIPDA